MIMKIKEEDKDLNYWKKNCEEDYLHTPISVLRYITKLESKVNNIVLDDVINCPRCGGSYVVTDLDDRCLCKDCKTKWRVCL